MESLALQPAVWWLCVGFGLLIVEMLTGTLFFLCISAGAFLVALLTWVFSLSAVAQAVFFAIAAVVAVTVWRKLRPNPHDSIEQRAGARGLNNRLAAYVGRDAVLEEAIVNGHGRVRIDDSYWNVAGSDMPAGTRVRVTSVEGMILQVQRSGD
jgi:membrane protein implicated in regulation of membrane protease activity